MNASIRNKPRFIFAVAVVLIVSLTQPPHAVALPECEIWDYYYSGCGTLTTIEYHGVDCIGQHFDYVGSGTVKWWYHSETICQVGGEFGCDDPGDSFYEWCPSTSSWKPVSASAFWNASCSCS